MSFETCDVGRNAGKEHSGRQMSWNAPIVAAQHPSPPSVVLIDIYAYQIRKRPMIQVISPLTPFTMTFPLNRFPRQVGEAFRPIGAPVVVPATTISP